MTISEFNNRNMMTSLKVARTDLPLTSTFLRSTFLGVSNFASSSEPAPFTASPPTATEESDAQQVWKVSTFTDLLLSTKPAVQPKFHSTNVALQPGTYTCTSFGTGFSGDVCFSVWTMAMFQNYYGSITCEKIAPPPPPPPIPFVPKEMLSVEALAKSWEDDLSWGAAVALSTAECVLNAQSMRQVSSFCSPELPSINPSISGVVFANGYFPYAAGLFVGCRTKLSLSDCSFRSNHAFSDVWGGAGIFVADYSSLSVNMVSFISNTAISHIGDDIYNFNGRVEMHDDSLAKTFGIEEGTTMGSNLATGERSGVRSGSNLAPESSVTPSTSSSSSPSSSSSVGGGGKPVVFSALVVAPSSSSSFVSPVINSSSKTTVPPAASALAPPSFFTDVFLSTGVGLLLVPIALVVCAMLIFFVVCRCPPGAWKKRTRDYEMIGAPPPPGSPQFKFTV